jgi:hypothetical protein
VQLLKHGELAEVAVVCVAADLLCLEMPEHMLKNVLQWLQDVMFAVQLDLVAVMQTHLDLEAVACLLNFVGSDQELTDAFAPKEGAPVVASA